MHRNALGLCLVTDGACALSVLDCISSVKSIAVLYGEFGLHKEGATSYMTSAMAMRPFPRHVIG